MSGHELKNYYTHLNMMDNISKIITKSFNTMTISKGMHVSEYQPHLLLVALTLPPAVYPNPPMSLKLSSIYFY